jgi:small nuclear ribonucleoprotein (snRNP)-like protein
MFASQNFTKELALFVNEEIKIETVNGDKIDGTLIAYDPGTLSIILEDAFIEGEEFKRIMVNGNSVVKIYLKEKRVDMEKLAGMIEKRFPKLVEYRKELGVILVMNRIRVSEEGVEGPSGPATERVQKIYENFIGKT